MGVSIGRQRGGLWAATPILPKAFKDTFNKAALQEYLYDEADDVVKRLQSKISHWKHKVTFDVDVTAFYFPMRMNIIIKTDDKPYIYVDGGTKSHWVRPKNAKALHWVDPVSGEDRFSKGHVVKGIKARRWTLWASKQFQKDLQKSFDVLMRDYADRSGHKIR